MRTNLLLLGSVLVAAAIWSASGCIEQPPSSFSINTSGGVSSSSSGGGFGGESSGSGLPTTAKEYFTVNVFPELSQSCGVCHSKGVVGAPIYLTDAADGSYTVIETYPKPLIAAPDNSMLRLKGEHAGPSLTPDQDMVVTEWLLMEVNERGLEIGTGGTGGADGGTTGSTTVLQALQEFGNCMNYDDFVNTGFMNLANASTSGFGPCKGCHNAGMGGSFLDDNGQLTYDKNKTFPYILKIATGTVDKNGAFSDLVPANRFIEKGGEACIVEPCHPKFILPPDMVTAVESYFQLTYDRWKNNACPPPP